MKDTHKRSQRAPDKKRRSKRGSKRSKHATPTRERALALLSDLRNGNDSYSELLRKHHLDTRTAHKYLGKDLRGGAGGRRVGPTKSDRRLRTVMFPTSVGDLPIRTRSSRDAARISEYFRDRDKLLRGKLSADDFEAKWRGVRIAGEQIFADAAAILRMADAGDLKLENLYASVESA